MSLSQLTPPTVEPITVAEAKNHLRIDADITQDDTLIALLIGAARRFAEMKTGRSFITQQWRRTLDAFPCYGGAVVLERGPVQAITSVSYQDMTGAWQVMPAEDYVADIAGSPERIALAFGRIWPIALPQLASVRVDYRAGFGDDAAAVPEGIRQWMLLRLTTLYEHREEAEVISRGRLEPMPFVDGLLDPYTVTLI